MWCRHDLRMMTERRLRAAVLVAAAAAACCTSGTTSGTGSSQAGLSTSAASPGSSVPNPFTITARFDSSSLGLHSPIALAVGSDGNVYVTDNGPAVSVISPDGNVIRRWGSEGSKPGEFSFGAPSEAHGSIAVGPDGRVYVSDSGNYRIQVFSPDGNFIRQFGIHGDKPGQLLRPFDLAVDQAGDVYVADDQGETVSKFSPTGSFVWRIGGFTATDPDLVGHEHLANIDVHGRVVMANDDKNRILYIDSRGHKVDAFSANACNVTVDAAGNTFVGGCAAGEQTEVFDRSHKLIGGWYAREDPLISSPVFGPNGEVFGLGADGSIIRLKVTLPSP